MVRLLQFDLDGIPFPCVLLGHTTQTGQRLLHTAEQDSAAALVVPDQPGRISGTGHTGGLKLGPLALRGIPLPGVAKRDRNTAPLVIRGIHSRCAAPEEQHLARGFLEDHALLAAIAWPVAGAGIVGESAARGIPLPDVSVVDVHVAGGHASAEYDEVVVNRVKDHACTAARFRREANWGALGPCAGRGIPLPQILKLPRVAQAAEHDQDLAGLVKGGCLHVARARAQHGRAHARPGGDFAGGHHAQRCVGRLKARASRVSGMVLVAAGEQEQSPDSASS